MIEASVIVRRPKKDYLKKLDNDIYSAMNDLLSYGKDKALSNKKGNKDSSLINTSITKTNNGYKGVIATNFDFAPFLEYGTGRKAELPHIGHTRTFKRSGFQFWYAPADKVNKQYSDRDYMEFDGEMFPMNAYMDGQKYVMVFEQSPKPFMRPTAMDLEENAPKIITESFRKGN